MPAGFLKPGLGFSSSPACRPGRNHGTRHSLRRLCLRGETSVRTSDVIRGWSKILKGEPPSLSIEITRECPLRCPGCYAYDAGHLGGGVTLRDLNDRKGPALVDAVLEVVDRLKPLHLSIW